jgi:hypothetical protein
MSSAPKFVTYNPIIKSNKRKGAVKPAEEEVSQAIRQVHEYMVSAFPRLAGKLTEADLEKMTEDRRFVAGKVKHARTLVEEIKKTSESEAEKLEAELKEVLDGLKGQLGKVGKNDSIHNAAVERVVYLKPGTLDDLVANGKCTELVGEDGEYKSNMTIPRSLLLGAAGGNGQPQVPMDDLEAIVGCNAQKTKENYAQASAVHGTPQVVHATITALCNAAEAEHEKAQEPAAKAHMLKVFTALTFIKEAYEKKVAEGVADADETTMITLLHLVELRTQQTPLWQMWPLFSAPLLQAAHDEAGGSMSEENAMESMRALATQMHKIVDKMREGVHDAGVYEYFVMMPAKEAQDEEMAHESAEEEQVGRMSSAEKRVLEAAELPCEKRQQRGRESSTVE